MRAHAAALFLALIPAIPAASAPPFPGGVAPGGPPTRAVRSRRPTRGSSRRRRTGERSRSSSRSVCPEEARSIGVLSARRAERRAFVKRLGEEVESEYAPFGIRLAWAYETVPALLLGVPRSAVPALAGDPGSSACASTGRSGSWTPRARR